MSVSVRYRIGGKDYMPAANTRIDVEAGVSRTTFKVYDSPTGRHLGTFYWSQSLIEEGYIVPILDLTEGKFVEINYMEIAKFQKLGYLHESNRLFFHPRGLALEMNTGFDRKEVEKKLSEAGYQYGMDAVDNVMTAVKLFGLDKPHLSGVWDYRDDPEGMSMGDLDQEKIAAVEAEYQKHIDARTALFGGPIQTEDYRG